MLLKPAQARGSMMPGRRGSTAGAGGRMSIIRGGNSIMGAEGGAQGAGYGIDMEALQKRREEEAEHDDEEDEEDGEDDDDDDRGPAAATLTENQTTECRAIFDEMDEDGSGGDPHSHSPYSRAPVAGASLHPPAFTSPVLSLLASWNRNRPAHSTTTHSTTTPPIKTPTQQPSTPRSCTHACCGSARTSLRRKRRPWWSR